MAKQHGFKLLARVQASSHGILPGTAEVARRLIPLIGDRDAHELCDARRPRQ